MTLRRGKTQKSIEKSVSGMSENYKEPVTASRSVGWKY